MARSVLETFAPFVEALATFKNARAFLSFIAPFSFSCSCSTQVRYAQDASSAPSCGKERGGRECHRPSSTSQVGMYYSPFLAHHFFSYSYLHISHSSFLHLHITFMSSFMPLFLSLSLFVNPFFHTFHPLTCIYSILFVISLYLFLFPLSFKFI